MKKLNVVEIEILLANFNKGEKLSLSIDAFKSDCERYIKASKENRIMCNIESVSKSGMSRTMSFFEMTKNKYTKEYGVLNFWSLYKALGYTSARNSDGFLINRCGMDMVFATHYNVIHDLKYLGFINDATCKVLSQKTPHKI